MRVRDRVRGAHAHHEREGVVDEGVERLVHEHAPGDTREIWGRYREVLNALYMSTRLEI